MPERTIAMRKPRLLVIGNTNMDFVCVAERFPAVGETLFSAGDYFLCADGKGANAALCAARLGADAVLCTGVGADSNGRKIADSLEKEKIDTRFVFFDNEQKTDFSMIFREPGEKKRTVRFPGAGASLSVDHAEEAFTCYPDALLLACDVIPEIVYYGVQKAKEQKIPAILNLAPAQTELDPSSIDACEIITSGEDEIAYYTDIAPTSAENALRAAIKLSALIHTKYVVIRLGKRGAFVYDGLHQELIPALDVRAVDTTGAGEAFTSSLAVRYMQNGGNISDAARFAVCVSAYSVLKSGEASFPTVKELEEFINRYNNR